MGVDKATMRLSGEPLICSVLRAIGEASVTLLGEVPGLEAAVDSCDTHADIRYQPDHVVGEGPFAAVARALTTIDRDRVVVLSCDLPYVTSEALEELAELHWSTGADLAVPLIGGTRQWHTFALSTTVSDVVHRRYARGVRSFRKGLRGLREVVLVPSHPALFRDVDTPEEAAAVADYR